MAKSWGKMKPAGDFLMNLLSLSLFFIVLNVVAVEARIPHLVHGRPRGGKLGSPAGTWRGRLPPDQWVTQRLDHFNAADTRTWQQRYFVNATFFKPGGPVFLMIGGEGTASPVWMVMGQWITYAQKYNALCLQLEHRYYGKSHPTKDMSVTSLQHLSSEQALADLAHFRVNISKAMNLTTNKWITFGGSYPGALSAWFRAKYPHLVHGAVSTSAPMIAQLNFKEYLGVVQASLATTKPGVMCNQMISVAVATIEGLLKTDKGRKQLKATFQLCEDINPSNPLDVTNLHALLAGNFEGIVQYNKDNRAFEGAKATNITIDLLCATMTDSQEGDIVSRYGKVNNILLKAYGQKCLDFKYDSMIKEMRREEWTSSAGEGGRQWTYQTCTEFGYYQTSDLDKQPFGHFFPLNFSIQQCMDIFGNQFNQGFIQAGVDATNEMYGGYGLQVSRVAFVSGSIDPWHALSITKSPSPQVPVIFINGTAHCANMYPDSPTDPPQLKAARTQISTLIGQWLKQSS